MFLSISFQFGNATKIANQKHKQNYTTQFSDSLHECANKSDNQEESSKWKRELIPYYYDIIEAWVKPTKMGLRHRLTEWKLGQRESRKGLSKRTFCNNENTLYQYCPINELLGITSTWNVAGAIVEPKFYFT